MKGNNNVWKIYDLEAYEAVNIVVALGSLKIDDKEFISMFFDLIEKKIE